MAAAANHSHRAGRLKQQNKKNKRSAASKRSVTRRQGGKINALPSLGGRKGPKTNDAGAGRAKAKANRMNLARQRREAKRKGAWDARRGLGAAGGSPLHRALATPPPRIVGIVSLSELEGPLEERVRRALMGGADHLLASSGNATLSSGALSGALAGAPASVTAAYPAHAKGGRPHVTFLTNATAFAPQYSTKYNEEDASVQGALDLCRICDTVLFLMDGRSIVTRADHAASSASGGGFGGFGGGGGMSLGGATAKTSATTAHLDHLVSARGDRILAAVKAQGIPTPVTVVVYADEMYEGTDAGGGSVVGRHVGGGAFSMEDDDSDDDEVAMEDDDEAVASLPGTLATARSAKSLRRSRLRKRSELKRYAARFSATEFGEHGRVAELDVAGNDEEAGAVGMVGKMDGAAFSPRGVFSASAGTTATSAAATATTSATAGKAQASAAALVRLLCTSSAAGPNWVADAPRPYLVADGPDAVRYDAVTQELEMTGYIRGNAPWNCNHLVHVPHVGTYAVKHIQMAGVNVGEDDRELLPPIVAAGRKVRGRKGGKAATMEAADDAKDGANGVVLAVADPEERESLAMFASPDALEGEQNLIGFDDDDDDDADLADRFDEAIDNSEKKGQFQPGTARPAGWSDYQSAWLDALDADNEEEEDRGELAFALNKKSKPDDNDALMDDDDADVNAEEKRLLLASRKKSRADDLQFPDEVDCEEEGAARERYARYRALKSFRKSHWDPKENLPEGYGAVYHFGSFRATQRDVLGEAREMEGVVRRRGWGVNVGEAKGGDDDDVDMARDSDDEEEEATARACVPPGAYVTITLEGVAPSAYAGLSPHALATAVSLLPHENKVSVLHVGLSPSSGTDRDDEIPVKSKDVLTFRCGWRTWQCRPIFSQLNLNSDKHKFERYMPSGGGAHFAATVYGPATYAPCPVLVFRESRGSMEERDGEGRREFLAHGSMLGADADRIVLKRIVLTGYPTRVHKRHATVKYMFYNPDDVRWFMPAGLSTKHGLQGNIVQSVGDHGVMKCLFNAPIKQHDTVCLPLYKRVYPKFAPVEGEEEGTGKHFRVL